MVKLSSSALSLMRQFVGADEPQSTQLLSAPAARKLQADDARVMELTFERNPPTIERSSILGFLPTEGSQPRPPTLALN